MVLDVNFITLHFLKLDWDFLKIPCIHYKLEGTITKNKKGRKLQKRNVIMFQTNFRQL